MVKAQSAYESFGIPGSSSVAYGYDFYAIVLHHAHGLGHGFHLLVYRRMREYYIVMQKFSLLIKTDHLASGPEAGVYGHSPLLPYRSGQKQLLEILAENLHGLKVRPFLGGLKGLVLHGWVKKPCKAVFLSQFQLIEQFLLRISFPFVENSVYYLQTNLRICFHTH